jgi:phosphomannomutase/phosphoglucomutase
MQYPKEIFKAYDIRGIVGKNLTNQIVHDIGNILGQMVLEVNLTSINVGYDGRLSSPNLAKSLIDGIRVAGCNVINVGQVTTPLVYFANYELNNFSGVMITGSHNPPEYNGLKIVINNETLSSDKIQLIYERLKKGKNVKHEVMGSYSEQNVVASYINKIKSDVKLHRKVTFVVDAGNGVAGKIAPLLYRKLGAKVLGLFCEVDGNFPNHHPDPSHPENLIDLINAVKSSNAEFGLAFDGDGDRLGVVTKDGNIIYPDRQLMLFVADILNKNKKAKILYDVKSTMLLKDWIIENGGEPIICKTGHSLVKAKIKETGALIAGEMSGHLFFNDRWLGFDDGVYAGARLIEILSQVEDPSLLLNAIPNTISTPEINIKVDEGEQHKIIENIKKTMKINKDEKLVDIDGIRIEYEDGFGLVRASNTTPVLVLRFEAKTKEKLKIIKNRFKDILSLFVEADF